MCTAAQRCYCTVLRRQQVLEHALPVLQSAMCTSCTRTCSNPKHQVWCSGKGCT